MTHPYPPHLENFTHIGKYNYALRFCTHQRARVFTDGQKVDVVMQQILRAAREREFELTAYCWMPDQVHLLVRGLTDTSNCRAFIKAVHEGLRSPAQEGDLPRAGETAPGGPPAQPCPTSPPRGIIPFSCTS